MIYAQKQTYVQNENQLLPLVVSDVIMMTSILSLSIHMLNLVLQ